MMHTDSIRMTVIGACVSFICVSFALPNDIRAEDDDEIVFEIEDVEEAEAEAGAEIEFDDEEEETADSDASPETVEAFLGEFKFGMTEEQVMGVVTKEISDRYEQKIRSSLDTYKQDNLRRQRTEEVKRVKKTLTKFDGTRSGWDASIIDDQFAHGTDESMFVSWEAKAGQGQRKFFFFFKGKLYKVMLALDVSQLDEEQRDFDTYANSLRERFGNGKTNYVGVLWNIGTYRVEALNKLAFYTSFCLVMSDSQVLPALIENRKKKAIKLTKKSRSLRFLIEDDPDTSIDLDESSNVVDDILKKTR